MAGYGEQMTAEESRRYDAAYARGLRLAQEVETASDSREGERLLIAGIRDGFAAGLMARLGQRSPIPVRSATDAAGGRG